MLLDTQALLWAMGDSLRLGKAARNPMKAQAEPLSSSEASICELGIKRGRGDIELLENFVDEVEGSGFQLLPASAALFWASEQLPRHHRDPSTV